MMGWCGEARGVAFAFGSAVMLSALPGCDPAHSAHSAREEVEKTRAAALAPDEYGGEVRLVAVERQIDARFGAAVALQEDRVFVGAPVDIVGETYGHGTVSIFRRDADGFHFEQQLVAADGHLNAHFGRALAVRGSRLFVGAPDTLTAGVSAGAVYTYVSDGSAWTFEQRFSVSDGNFYDRFGCSIGLSGDRAVIGARSQDVVEPNANDGAAYVFRFQNGAWTQVQKLLPPSDSDVETNFGASVAFDGDRVLIGAPGYRAGHGSVFAYVWTGSRLELERELRAAEGSVGDRFGTAVAVLGDRALISADQDDVGSAARQGSAYVFTRTSAGWSEQQQLTTSSPVESAMFGSSVALATDRALVGGSQGGVAALTFETSTIGADYQGFAELYAWDGAAWTHAQTFAPADLEREDAFGWALAIDDAGLLIGAPNKDVYRGVVYAYEYGLMNGRPCATAAECANGHCVDGVCCDTACDAACDACSVAAGASTDGRCEIVAPGSAGSPACAPLACNGTSRDCEPCAEDEHCPPGIACDAERTCRKEDGAACERDAECASGFCVDGVCCESACDAQCAACAEPGSLGRCVAAAGAPRGDRPACEGDPRACGGACDGAEIDGCRYAPVTRVCGRSCDGDRALVDQCDGAGRCAPGDAQSCGDYACGADGCLTSCGSDADCSAGRRCAGGSCVPADLRCSDDLTRSLPADGEGVACAPYRCDPTTGACRTLCNRTFDCAPEHFCDPDRNECTPSSGSSDDGGCGCRVAPRRAPGAGLLALLAAAALARRRLRRSARASSVVRQLLAISLLAGCRPDATSEAVSARSQAPLTYGGEAKIPGTPGSAELFGSALATRGDRVLIGAPFDAIGENAYQGSASSFTRDGRGFRLEQKLVASDGTRDDTFGGVLRLEADRAFVSAVGADDALGAVYEFLWDGAAWVDGQRLIGSQRALYSVFGSSLAISGDVLLVGSSRYSASGEDTFEGGVFVFVRSGGVWTETQILTASDGATNDSFGGQMAFSGDRVLVGALAHQAFRGAAYVYTWNGSRFVEEHKLVAADGQPGDFFGGSVALLGDRALVGALQDDVGTNADQGSVYVFLWSGSAWVQEQKLVASDGAPGAHFGQAVALETDRALIGAPEADRTPDGNQGAAYVFTRAGAVWTERQQLVASDGVVEADFGADVALSLERAVVSAPTSGSDGAVYTFEYGLEDAKPCAVDAECANGYCSDSVCCDTACAGACDACSRAAGAAEDGVCAFVAAGHPGSPACRDLACTGTNADCASCRFDRDCPAGASCADDRTCRKADGAHCEAAGECGSGFCVDGVCCDRDCAEQCVACAEPGLEGTCVAVAGAPRGERAPCTGEPALCGGECDGTETVACRYAPAMRACGRRCAESVEVAGACDGRGACVEGDARSCGDYACDVDRCRTSCGADSDCSPGRGCQDGACVPADVTCSEDLRSSLLTTGEAIACAPYLCDRDSGACRVRCDRTSECALDFFCDLDQHACAEASSAGSDAGCGCRVPSGRGGPAPFAPGMLFVAAWLIRRRRAATDRSARRASATA